MIRVAIIEDDPNLRRLLVAAVDGAHDMSIAAQAANFADGCALVQAGGYDVLLCDLGLPDGNGTALIQQEFDTGRDTDILVVTVFANQNKVIEAIEAGARGYLLKDERVEDCIEAIRNIQEGGSPISPIIARQLLGQIQRKPASGAERDTPDLSDRELEVLNLISRGFSNAECGELLNISSNTVATHIKKIYRKLQVHSRAEALFEASSKGLLHRP